MSTTISARLVGCGRRLSSGHGQPCLTKPFGEREGSRHGEERAFAPCGGNRLSRTPSSHSAHGPKIDSPTVGAGPCSSPLSWLLHCPTPKGERFSEQDILDGPTLIRGLRITLDFSEGDLLGKARQRATTFDRIAAALGLRSRQAAEQRYVKLYAGWDSPRATAAAHGATSEDSERSPLQRQAGRGGP